MCNLDSLHTYKNRCLSCRFALHGQVRALTQLSNYVRPALPKPIILAKTGCSQPFYSLQSTNYQDVTDLNHSLLLRIFFCDLYLQFITPINLWNKCIDLRLFLKYLKEPFLRPLRSKNWGLRTLKQSYKWLLSYHFNNTGSLETVQDFLIKLDNKHFFL